MGRWQSNCKNISVLNRYGLKRLLTENPSEKMERMASQFSVHIFWSIFKQYTQSLFASGNLSIPTVNRSSIRIQIKKQCMHGYELTHN